MNYDKQIQIAKAREYKVVKDNKLIQNIKGRKYELSVLEQKIVAFILSLIKPTDTKNTKPVYQYEFNINLFCKICGIDEENGKNYINIKNALQKLATNGFWIEENGESLFFQWIVTPRIKSRSGKVVIKISDDVMPYLLNLQENFTSYELYQILALKGSHSIALYELLKSYAFRKKIVLEIDDIKQYLSIDGKYKEYKAFRRKVIEPAIAEINEYTDLVVEWQPIRTGRFYTAIEFRIDTKEQWEEYQAYRRTIDEITGKNIQGQINLFDYDDIVE